MQAPCIETVFQQFLDDGGRPLDDLAGRNPADYVVWKDMDFGGATGGGHEAKLKGTTRTREPPRAVSMDVRSSNFGQLILGEFRLVRRRELFDDPFEILPRFGEISDFSRREPRFEERRRHLLVSRVLRRKVLERLHRAHVIFLLIGGLSQPVVGIWRQGRAWKVFHKSLKACNGKFVFPVEIVIVRKIER